MNTLCLICVTPTDVSIACAECKQSLCIDCDINMDRCPFCRCESRTWTDRLLSEHASYYLQGAIQKEYIKTMEIQNVFRQRLVDHESEDDEEEGGLMDRPYLELVRFACLFQEWVVQYGNNGDLDVYENFVSILGIDALEEMEDFFQFTDVVEPIRSLAHSTRCKSHLRIKTTRDYLKQHYLKQV